MKTLEELERVKQAGPDLLEALEAIYNGLLRQGPTKISAFAATEIARMAIQKAKKP
jgi:hypothetical protein